MKNEKENLEIDSQLKNKTLCKIVNIYDTKSRCLWLLNLTKLKWNFLIVVAVVVVVVVVVGFGCG